MTEENPKLFISYSWSNPDHQQWVINLATQLRESGVNVILDKWDLREGHDALAFMEKMVTDAGIKKVLLICDRIYTEKADGRSGGVGAETQIISPEIYAKEDQNKFVAVLTEKDDSGKPYLPTYYKSRIYIDLSEHDLYASNFEQLLRWIYDKPLHVKPELGDKPSFLSEDNPVLLGTTVKYQRALDAIRNNREHAKGALEEYFSTFAVNLERFRITNKEGEFDDQVVDNIEKFLPFRNEMIEIFLAIAQYRNTPETISQVHRFLESLIPYMDKPEGTNSGMEWDFDNFRFIVHEIFLYAIACLLKYECFNSVSYLLGQHYYVEDNSDYGKNVMVPFPAFGEYMKSLDHRNKRLQLKRLSIRADLLVQRSRISGINARQLMQADLVLFLRDAFESMKGKRRQKWWPETLIYLERFGGPFEIFARAQSSEYFNLLKQVFDIESRGDFELLVEAIEKRELAWIASEIALFTPDLSKIISLETMATLP